MNTQERMAELEKMVRELQANLELAWQTINLQSQIIKTIKDDGSDDLTFLAELGVSSEPPQRAS